jgi:hypothetical protein
VQAGTCDFFLKAGEENEEIRVCNELAASFGEELFGVLRNLALAPSQTKGPPALTSRARPCPRACILGRTAIGRG